ESLDFNSDNVVVNESPMKCSSGNKMIDIFLKSKGDQFLWISYNYFRDIRYLPKSGFGTVYKAKWNKIEVVLKCLYSSVNINIDFLEEANSHKNFMNYNGVIQLYGITHDPFKKNYLMVMNKKVCDGKRPDITEDTRNCFKELMIRCWDNDPLQRPTINEVYKTLSGWKSSENEQFEEAERKLLNPMQVKIYMNFTHSEAIYTSRLLNNMIKSLFHIDGLAFIPGIFLKNSNLIL
ncbi:27190_t:CDS:2, partial [Dentiscutata erythropus]